MTTTQIIRLNQTQWKVPQTIHAVQNDTGRSLKMIIEDEVIPSGATATLSINRADGTYYDITGATLSTADNSFTVDITQALTTPGDTKCQLKVAGIVSTYTFIIEVERDTSGTVSPQEGISLAEAVEEAEDARDEAVDAMNVARIATPSVNLFDKSTVTTNSYLNSAGAIKSGDTTCVSAQIEVTPGTTIILSHHLNSSSRYNVFQNASGNFITGESYPCNADNMIFTVPNGAKYLRCTVGNTVIDDFTVVEQFEIIRHDQDIKKLEQQTDSTAEIVDNLVSNYGYDSEITEDVGFTNGKAVYWTDGELHNSTVGAYSGFVEIPDGFDAILLTMVIGNNSAARGIAFYSSASQSSFISGYPCRSDSSLTVWGQEIVKVPIPDGAKYFRTTWVATTYEAYEDFDFACSFISEGKATNKFNPYERYTVKSFGENPDGFSHCAFPSMAIFAGKEVIAYRASKSHYTPTDSADWGGIMIDTRDPDGTWTHVGLLDTSDVTFDGELRDPKLTVSRDGKTLFVSAFTTYRTEEAPSVDVHDNVIFALDGSLEVSSAYVDSDVDYTFYGNVIQTPEGHLLVCGYGNDTVMLYRSTAAYEDDLSEVAFGTPIVLSSSYAQEPTIGYFNDMLVCFYRRHTYASHILFTHNLEGDSGWSEDQEPDEGLVIHAPVLLPYFTGNLLPFAGALYYSNTLRKPIIGVLKCVDDDFQYYDWNLIDNEIGEYSGYCGIAYLCGDIFADAYYEESTLSYDTLGASTAVYYKQIPLRVYCPALAYESLGSRELKIDFGDNYTITIGYE